MSIELTGEQLRSAEASPVRVTDPETRREYFLLGKETYYRLQEMLYDDSPWTDEEMDALAWETGKNAGWDDPRMDEYNDYDPHREKTMTLKRGDIGLARFPHTAGARGKKRPVVVVQADAYNAKARSVVVAEVTTNLADGNDPAHLLIDISTPDGKATGLLHDSVVSCLWIASVNADRVDPILGKLSDALLQRLNDCLIAALDLA